MSRLKIVHGWSAEATLWLGIAVLLLSTVVSGEWNGSAVAPSCEPGSRPDPKSGECVVICRNASGVGCRTSAQDVYSLTREEEDEPVVRFSLPACKDVTLRGGDFSVGGDGRLTVNLGKVAETLSRYRLGADNQTADVCYPLSPQLLQCALKRLDPRRYVAVARNGSLVDRRTGDVVDYRDYYTSGGGEPLGCTKPINAGRKLRCNYVRYVADEYEFVGGNASIRILPTGGVIYRPQYTDGGNGTIDLCYPSSPELTTCTLWVLEAHEFAVLPDHTLHEFSRQARYLPSDYLLQKGKGLICVQAPAPPPDLEMHRGLAACQLVSAVLLLIALVIHLLIPSLNYHAKPLLCHMFSMTVMYVCLACRQLLTMSDPTGCYTLFVFTYLFVAASFFWLNVLAFDLWCIFANLQTSSGAWFSCCGGATNKHRFYYYSVYAWGCPVLLLVFVVLVDTHQSLQDALRLYPGLAGMCWFNNWKSALLLIYVPLFVVLACNLMLFVLTVVNLRRASKGVEIVNKKLNKQLLFVCFKIFIVMGLSWISEALSYSLNTHGGAIFITDIINATQGVIIFAIYICKPATYRLLRKKFSGTSKSDGKWTTDFNTSKSVERKTSSSGLSMNSVAIPESCINSDYLHVKKKPLAPIKSNLDVKI